MDGVQLTVIILLVIIALLLGVIAFILWLSDLQTAMEYDKKFDIQKDKLESLDYRIRDVREEVEKTNSKLDQIYRSIIDAKLRSWNKLIITVFSVTYFNYEKNEV